MKIYYMNSTHWDREWYLPFQSFRFNLVEVTNELIDILESEPEYKLFCFDGQTIVLEDYAEIEPERAARLKKLIEDGRILVGPWYVMPDEFLTSGESLIRNLMVGDKLAKKWGGKTWKYGYVNDIFGHIAQMPQIFAGFDIHGAYLGRGLGNKDYGHFKWISPDGTTCFATLGRYGAFAVRGPKPDYDSQEFKDKLKNWIEQLAAKSIAPVVFFSNTDDHRHADRETPKVLKMIGELFPDAEVCDVDLTEMVKELEKHKEILPTVVGELSEPLDKRDAMIDNMPVLYHCLSSYYPLKQENDRCQNMLEKRIEPMLAYAEIEGNPINHTYTDLAYQYLLQNHPHDSICGCSVDQVHKDMIYRFDQTQGICNRLNDRFYEFENDIHKALDSGSEYMLKMYNNQSVWIDEYREVKIGFFKGYPSVTAGYAGKEVINQFKVFDDDGNEIEYQILHVEKNVQKRIVSLFQSARDTDVYTICMNVKIPPCGYSTYKVMPAYGNVAYTKTTMCYGDTWVENELIKVDISPNGLITIFDKRTGREYTRLNNMIDNGEIGDGWHHQKPVNDFEVTAAGSEAVIRRISSGIAQVSFKITKEMTLPAFLDATTNCRSTEEKKLKIDYIVTVKRNSPVVVIQTEIDNNIKDHRLRVVMPTGKKTDKYFAGQAFYMVERESGVDPKTANWVEPECLEKNMNGIIGTRDEEGEGLAFVSAEGLHEGGCDKNGDLLVTLYRCFDRVFLEKTAQRPQLQQKLMFKYAIVPICSDDTYADLLGVQHRLSDADIVFSKRVADDTEPMHKKSYLTVANSDIVLSIFKCAQDGEGYVVRLFNTTDQDIDTTVQTGFMINEAYLTNMLEEAGEELQVENNQFTIRFKPWEIKTIRFNAK